jgi:hypothetical protein
MTTKETRLNIRIGQEELAEIKAFADAHNMSVSEFVLTASRSFMGKGSNLEDQVLALGKRLLDLETEVARIKNQPVAV